MARFADTLAAHPAPTRLGDIALRYEPSMLIGETPKVPPSLRPTAVWLGGISSLVISVGLLLMNAPIAPIVIMAGLGAVGIGANVWLERVDKRRRRFVANFATNSLRLDFVTPFAGRPRTLVVPFDSVKDVQLLDQGGGQSCLTVDFVPLVGRPQVLREVLAAFIPEAQREGAERLERVLKGAFGLGEIPEDSPFHDEEKPAGDAEAASPVDEFH
ncbi:MAG: hypothetical protein AB1730_23750 [Myxococcota bacterium]|jgi:hypothetical protein